MTSWQRLSTKKTTATWPSRGSELCAKLALAWRPSAALRVGAAGGVPIALAGGANLGRGALERLDVRTVLDIAVLDHLILAHVEHFDVPVEVGRGNCVLLVEVLLEGGLLVETLLKLLQVSVFCPLGIHLKGLDIDGRALRGLDRLGLDRRGRRPKRPSFPRGRRRSRGRRRIFGPRGRRR